MKNPSKSPFTKRGEGGIFRQTGLVKSIHERETDFDVALVTNSTAGDLQSHDEMGLLWNMFLGNLE